MKQKDAEIANLNKQLKEKEIRITKISSTVFKFVALGFVFSVPATYAISFSVRSDEERLFNLSIYDPTGQSTVFTTGPLTVTPNGPNAYGWDHDSNLFFFTYNSANAANLEFQLGNFGDGNSDGVRFDFDNVHKYQ